MVETVSRMMPSLERRARTCRFDSAPDTAPIPNEPDNRPKVTALPPTRWLATSGSSEGTQLAAMPNRAERISTRRICGDSRT